MDQACAAVEWVCGARFRSRPRLYVQPLDDLVAVYREEDLLRQERCGEEAEPAEPSWFKLRVEHHLGSYLQGLHGVCVSRLAVENSVDGGARRSLLSADGLRLILVHEVAHALDHERHQDLFGRCVWDPEDAARGAVSEGHAQHVTAIVAGHWGLGQVFADLRAQYGGGTPESEELKRTQGHADGSFFRYVAGQDFIDAVFDAGGRTAVESVLADPPLSASYIQNPTAWIEWRVTNGAPVLGP